LAEGLNAKGIHKEMFPVYGGKRVSRKAVYNWVNRCGKRFADDEEVKAELQKWLKQRSKGFCAAGFDALVKQWYKCIVVEGYVEK
jgi:hypothetical protein